ncbi:hypothetical protein BDZ97DRAFT_528289 [Flammula alnicola]|nr:hypothetical protein BDZ97DRAFT_528289 [Flammula alnicola]
MPKIKYRPTAMCETWSVSIECHWQWCGGTYLLEVHKIRVIATVREAIGAQQQVHLLPGNAQVRRNRQRVSWCSINKFTYKLEMRKQGRIVRGLVGAQSISSRTRWKCASEMESLEGRSVRNQQVHVQPGNVQARRNHQRAGRYPINNSRTIWKCTDEMESSEGQLVLNQ